MTTWIVRIQPRDITSPVADEVIEVGTMSAAKLLVEERTGPDTIAWAVKAGTWSAGAPLVLGVTRA